MSEVDKLKKIQPVISGDAYEALLFVKAKERTTITAIVEKSIKEYVQAHYPEYNNK